ncbi:MAG TPA: hypothetical protein VHZ51_05610 [Ktedonobacteraceae bacterium]|jgi:ribose 1,5-bisphosphokinase PhnN|nr:hypothetical protein [Ktedonobacteraceae bacterium]
MFAVCHQCGKYAVEKEIDPDGPFAICPYCNYAHPFLRQPLFVITGPSGAGKTAMTIALTSVLRDCAVVLETDILWGAIPAGPENDYQNYHDAWLSIAMNIGQSGRPVVLCGTATPKQLNTSPISRYFAQLHMLALVCDDDILIRRLQDRPQWRKADAPEFIARMVQFNQWLKENATQTKPPMTLYDTGCHSLAETTEGVAQWIHQRL